MKTVKVDAGRRLHLPFLRPGDYYEPERRNDQEIVLRRVPEPTRTGRMTRAQALRAIETSPLKFTVTWDELRLETRR